MLEPSRRHGHCDERWGATSAPRFEDAKLEPVADGLSWEAFNETLYSAKRHFFPAIRAWSLYRDSNRAAAAAGGRGRSS